MSFRTLKHVWTVGALGLAAGLIFSDAALAAGDTIIYARPQDADSLDAHKVSTTISFQVMQQIYGTLLSLDDNGNVHPGYAEKYEVSDDGLTYRFTMRQGIKCHDGTPFDAAAVKWNFDRVTDPDVGSPNGSSYGDITSTTVEGNDVVVKLGSAYSPLPRFLGGVLSIMMCPSAIDGDDVKAIGAGPWKFVSWDRNNELVLERNEDYVNVHPLVKNPGPPYMKRLVFKNIPEGAARMAALRSGEVDLAEPSLPDAAQLKDDPDYKVYTSPLSGQQAYVAFAHKIPPFDDVRARRAVGYAIDRNVFADIAFEGLVQATECPIAPGLVGEDQAFCQEHGTAYDPDKAKSLLAELGYGPDNPLDVILSVAPLQGWSESHVIMQQQLREVGINAKMEERQFAAWVDHMSVVNDSTEGTPVVWTMGMSGVDPDYLVFLWQRPGYANQGIEDPILDQMLREQRTLSGDARVQKLKDIQKFLLVNAYEIPTYSPGWFWLSASRANVEGFFQIQVAMPIFNDVKINE